MNLLNKCSVILLASCGIMLSACDTDNEGTLYTPANAGVSLDISAISMLLPIEQAGTDVNVRVIRANKKGAYTFKYAVEISDETIFSDVTNGQVAFADNEGTANIQIKGENLQIGKEYTIVVKADTITGKADLSAFSPVLETKVTVMRDYTWENAGTVSLTSALVGGPADIAIEKAKEYDGNLYRLVSPFNVLDPEETTKGYHIQFILDANYDALSIPTKFQDTGLYASGMGEFYLGWFSDGSYGSSFTNENKVYIIKGVYAYDEGGTMSLYDYATETFEWTKGYPKVVE